jgi:tetratricopeptide (TPR) repeat protein
MGQPIFQFVLVGIIGLAMGMEIVQATPCYLDEGTFSAYVAKTEGYSSTSREDLARLLWQEGHLDEAIKIYQEIWSTQPDTWDVNFNLGFVYHLTGKLPDADHYLSRAVQIDASQSDGFFYLGLTKLKLGDINAAAADVKKAIAIWPDADHYHRALGIILKLQGNLPGALSEFRAEMDLDPADTISLQQATIIEAILAAGQKRTPLGSPPAPGSSTAH